jgi:hypothetical protein
MDATRALLSAALLALALAGCTAPAVPPGSPGAPGSLSEGGLLEKSGQAQTARDCPGVGDLSYDVAGSHGSLDIVVTDGATGTVLDTGPLDGNAHSTVRQLLGGHDRWTLTVYTQSFTGSYSVALSC